MISRPRPTFIQRMRKEDPPKYVRAKLIYRYKKGGMKSFEIDVIKRMGNISMEQIYYTDPFTKEVYRWIYVGDYWWCRFRKFDVVESDKTKIKTRYKKFKRRRYEFARLMAVVNAVGENGKEQLDGLWDTRRHTHKTEPTLVYKNGRKGFIVSFSEYEVLIEWVNSSTGEREIAVPLLDDDGLTYEYVEDWSKFTKLFSLIKRKYVKKIC
jgi:hypothetical protein